MRYQIKLFNYFRLKMKLIRTSKRILIHIFILTIMFSGGLKVLAIDLSVKKIDGVEYYCYKVVKGDTMYSLPDKLGITYETLKEYNPGLADGLKKGMKIYFPKDLSTANQTQNESNEVVPIVIDDLTLTPIDAEVSIKDEPVQRELKVVVCQPFILDENPSGKTGTYATDFYRGLLMGIDSLHQTYGHPQIKITAIDCGNPDGPFDALKKHRNDFTEADVIVAPDALNRLLDLGKLGRANNVYVLNIFQSRDTTYNSNPYMIQGNIPTERMYAKAADWFVENLNGATPVFLDNTKSKRDKQAFVELLIRQLTRQGIDFKTVNFENTLTLPVLTSKLEEVTGDIVFIPTSGSLADFQKFATALNNYKSTLAQDFENNITIRLFGYPEYIRFSGDNLDKLRSIGTSYYTRFYNDPSSVATAKIKRSYLTRYGTALPEGVPNQALYGFDVARWLLNLASLNDVSREALESSAFDNGSQSSYILMPVEGGGMVNDVLEIVTLSTNNNPEVSIL